MVQGLIFALISACCYGAGPIIFKFAFAAGLTETEIILSRFLLGAAMLGLFFLFVDRSKLRAGPRTIARAAVLALGFYCVQTTCFILALRQLPAATNSLIFYAYPVTATLLSAVFLRFRISRLTLLSLALILAGGLLVCHDAFLRQAPLEGVLLSLASMSVFSLYLIVLQVFMRREDPLTLTFYVFVWMALAFSLVHSPTILATMGPERFTWAFLAAFFPTTLAVPLLYAAVRRIGSARTSIVSSFELVATLLLAAVFLHEEVNLEQIGGMVLILTGVALPNLTLLAVKARMGKGS